MKSEKYTKLTIEGQWGFTTNFKSENKTKKG